MKKVLLLITALLLSSCTIEYVGNDLDSTISSNYEEDKKDHDKEENKKDDDGDNHQTKLFDKVKYGRYQENDLISTIFYFVK